MTSAAITWDEAASDAAAEIHRRLSESSVLQTLPMVETLQWIEDDIRMLHRGAVKPKQLLASIGALALVNATTRGTWSERAEDVAQLAARKHHDYGTDNILSFGTKGIAVRMNDKLARIRNLEGRSTGAYNEALVDSWADLVGYSIVGLMVVDGTFTLPLEVDSPVKPTALADATPEQVRDWLYHTAYSPDDVRDVEEWLDLKVGPIQVGPDVMASPCVMLCTIDECFEFDACEDEAAQTLVEDLGVLMGTANNGIEEFREFAAQIDPLTEVIIRAVGDELWVRVA